MKPFTIVLGTLLVLGSAATGPAWADRGYYGHGGRGHSHGGGGVRVYLGPLLWPRYYAPRVVYPSYYPEVVTVVPPPPTTYIERSSPAPSGPASDSDYWYYCPSSKAYYPYVKSCSDDWLKVVPQPPSEP